MCRLAGQRTRGLEDSGGWSSLEDKESEAEEEDEAEMEVKMEVSIIL